VCPSGSPASPLRGTSRRRHRRVCGSVTPCAKGPVNGPKADTCRLVVSDPMAPLANIGQPQAIRRGCGCVPLSAVGVKRRVGSPAVASYDDGRGTCGGTRASSSVVNGRVSGQQADRRGSIGTSRRRHRRASSIVSDRIRTVVCPRSRASPRRGFHTRWRRTRRQAPPRALARDPVLSQLSA
jgi:hypothetical protein